MVHNGIEYGIMAAYAERASTSSSTPTPAFASREAGMPKPLRFRDPEAYQYRIQISQVTKVWRRGSVVASWLLDLIAGGRRRRQPGTGRNSRAACPTPARGAGQTAAAVDEGVPGTSNRRCLVRAIRVQGRRRLCRSAVVGHAQTVRRRDPEEKTRGDLTMEKAGQQPGGELGMPWCASA